MSDILEKQTVVGNLLDLGFIPEAGSLKISLNERVALYKTETEIIVDEKTFPIDANGDWQAELLDTDNMAGDIHYIFEINKRIYKRFVPTSVFDLPFTDLPNLIL
jgi:hypothetical protein